MGNAYWKDIWRTVKKEKKRFISIAVIAALGVTMMCGLRASCVDLRYSADAFFDEQKLFDIRVVSTLGISENDLTALEKVDANAEPVVMSTLAKSYDMQIGTNWQLALLDGVTPVYTRVAVTPQQ